MNALAGGLMVTILVNNKVKQGLRAEHGFAAWIEVAGQRLLFDTGQGAAIAGNAARLDIDLRETDALVLSHGHYDHTGGLPLVIERAPAVAVYAHRGVTGLRYAIRNGAAKSIAMPDAARVALEAHGSGVHWVTRPMEVAAGVGITGVIPRLTGYEDPGGPFYSDSAGAHPDPIIDDLALWLRTDRGLVVVVGCGHAGLINTLRHAQKVSQEARIHAVIGGFHLAKARDARLERTAGALAGLGVGLIVPCHCTGDVAVEKLRRTLGERVVPGAAGDVYHFSIAPAQV